MPTRERMHMGTQPRILIGCKKEHMPLLAVWHGDITKDLLCLLLPSGGSELAAAGGSCFVEGNMGSGINLQEKATEKIELSFEGRP